MQQAQHYVGLIGLAYPIVAAWDLDMPSFKKYKKGMHHIVQWLKSGHTRVVEIL
jgi:hypothetical protein